VSKKEPIYIPDGLFSLYIGNMALYPKNPENDKTEKYLIWATKILGPVAICVGVFSLYARVSILFLKHPPLGWFVFDIARALNIIMLGIGLLVHYKKSVNLFSRPLIYFSILLALFFIIFRDAFYYKPTLFPMVFIPIGIFGILFFIFYWIYFRNKYPEEFGVKS